jgi:TRAP-type C4-dicarboxylate transport system permease small subunit
MQNEINGHSVPKLKPLRVVDWVAEACGQIGYLMVIAISLMLTYEVTARYVFSAPTQWTQDIAVTFQIWFTYLGMALALKQRQMIRITAFLAIAPQWMRYVMEALALVVIAAFSAVAAIKGYDMLVDSIALGRRQPTMLALPNWIAEIPIVIGFGLLFIQACADLIRLPFGPAPSFSPGGEHDAESIEVEADVQGQRS